MSLPEGTTIREGGYYKRRDGKVVGPAEPFPNRIYPWTVGGNSYTVSGAFYTDEIGKLDLVAEVSADGSPLQAPVVIDPLNYAADPAHPLPDSNPKTAFGVKKTPLHLNPPPAVSAMAEVFRLGAQKYGAYNWRSQNVSASVYQAAALRHLFAFWEREDTDSESGQSHLAHAMACMAIIMDAKHHGTLNDDRPPSPAGDRGQA